MIYSRNTKFGTFTTPGVANLQLNLVLGLTVILDVRHA